MPTPRRCYVTSIGRIKLCPNPVGRPLWSAAKKASIIGFILHADATNTQFQHVGGTIINLPTST